MLSRSCKWFMDSWAPLKLPQLWSYHTYEVESGGKFLYIWHNAGSSLRLSLFEILRTFSLFFQVKGRFYRKINNRILPSLFIYKHHSFLFISWVVERRFSRGVGWYDDEWAVGKCLEENSHDLIEVLSQNLTGGTEGNLENPLWIAGVLASIQT